MDLTQLQNYALSPTFSDITYISGVDKTQIPGHKIIQSSSSAYLSQIFQKHPKIKQVQLPHPVLPMTQQLKADPTRKLLSLTYTEPKLQQLLDAGFGRDNCLAYYSIANSLQMKKVEDIILEYINQNLMNSQSASQFYLEATKFGNKGWEVKALDILAQSLDEIIDKEKDYEKILDLPFESFTRFLKRDDLYIASEDPLFDMVLRYIKEREGCPVNPKDMKAKDLLAMAVGKAVEEGKEKEEEEEKKKEEEKRGRDRDRGRDRRRDRDGASEKDSDEEEGEKINLEGKFLVI
jgi:hypothetical protein